MEDFSKDVYTKCTIIILYTYQLGKILKQRYSSKEAAKKANLIARSIFLVTQP